MHIFRKEKYKFSLNLDMARLVSGDATVSTDVGLLAQPHGDQGLASLASSAPAQIIRDQLRKHARYSRFLNR
jgi:hypothetical protein